MSKTNIFYVYIYLDPRKSGDFNYKIGDEIFHFDFEPFYVGLGSCDNKYYNRKYDHLSELRSWVKHKKQKYKKSLNIVKLRKLYKIVYECKLRIIILEICSNLHLDIAKKMEIDFINTIGRLDIHTGVLTNRCDGGGGCLGLSEETRKFSGEKISKFQLFEMDMDKIIELFFGGVFLNKK
jgi:hypothetical protein